MPSVKIDRETVLGCLEFLAKDTHHSALIYGSASVDVFKAAAQMLRDEWYLRDVLQTIAAQDSGVPGSTSRADCMAAIAAAAIRKGD